MSLDSNVQNRFSSQILINASNPQSSGATAIDSTRLTNSENDVVAAFSTLVGKAYDDTDATHVLFAVDGVLLRLLVLTGQAEYASWDNWKSALKNELAPVQGRDRLTPLGSSTLKVTPDQPGEYVQTDRSVFDRFFIPRSPSSSPYSSRDYLGNS